MAADGEGVVHLIPFFHRSVGSKKAETASTIMSFFLSSGLTAGALLSFVMLVIMGVDIIS